MTVPYRVSWVVNDNVTDTEDFERLEDALEEILNHHTYDEAVTEAEPMHYRLDPIE